MTMPHVSKQEIKQAINNIIKCWCCDDDPTEKEIDELVERLYEEINQFEELTEETVEHQDETYGEDTYHYGAKVGDWCWCDGECVCSASTVYYWAFIEGQPERGYSYSLEDLASIDKYRLVHAALEAANQGK